MTGANLPTEASRNCAVLNRNERTRSKVVARTPGCDHGAERALVPVVLVSSSDSKPFTRGCARDDLIDITKFQSPQSPQIRSKLQNNWHSKTSRPWRCREAF